VQYTRLGTSGLKISRIAMGTMSFGRGFGERAFGEREGWPIGYDDAARYFRQAVDLGINFWDTATATTRHLGGGGRSRPQGVHPPRRHRRADEGVLPGARRSGWFRSVA
jgi:hypothetical protein